MLAAVRARRLYAHHRRLRLQVARDDFARHGLVEAGVDVGIQGQGVSRCLEAIDERRDPLAGGARGDRVRLQHLGAEGIAVEREEVGHDRERDEAYRREAEDDPGEETQPR